MASHLPFSWDEGWLAPSGGAGCGDRDLAAEATIIDVREAMDGPAASPAGRRAALALRAAVEGLLPPQRRHQQLQQQRQQGWGQAGDGLDDLAQALADLLEGSGARVAVRAPLRRGGGCGGCGACGGCRDEAAAAEGAEQAAAAAAPQRAPRAAGKASFVLRGRFIVVKGEGDGEAEGFIIDPCFRDVFSIAPATPGYRRVVESLPEVFVGDASALRQLVSLLAAQAERSYSAQGLTTPPWRSRRALLARWFPSAGTNFWDNPVTPPASPLARMGSEEAAGVALAAAREAADGAIARLRAAGVGAEGALGLQGQQQQQQQQGRHAEPLRVVRGFALPGAATAV